MGVTRKRKKAIRLDDIDLQILSLLYENGRMSLVSIAEKVGLTHPSVKERLERLIDLDIIRIQANINVNKLGLILGLIYVDISDPKDLTELIRHLKDCPRVISMLHISGDYNLLIIIVASSESSLRAFVDRNIRSIKSVRKISTTLANVIEPLFIPTKVVPPEECKKYCETCVFNKELHLCSGCADVAESLKALRIK